MTLLGSVVALLLLAGLIFTPPGLNFIDAWRAWAVAHEPLHHYVLWGMPILWWGRIGKILEALGVFFILFDVFGHRRTSEAIRSFSEDLEPRRMWHAFQSVYEEVRTASLAQHLDMLKRNLSGYVLIGFLAIPLYHLLKDWLEIPSLAGRVVLAVVSFFLMNAILLVVLVVGGPPSRLFVRMTSTEARTRLLNLGVVFVGLMFDILAA